LSFTIDWTHFTPLASLLGGVLIGLASIALALFNGRIAGISGILGGLLPPFPGDRAWRVAFLLGLIVAPWAFGLVHPMPDIQVAASTPVLVIAGLLVGLGTRYAGGCTSGHGVCGLSRLSLRSMVATLSFMGAGFATVYMVRHLLAAGA
jgi:uncharacterized membrane protein YedE/YeeE